MAQARAALRERQPRLDAGKLVFVDESSVKTNLTRSHGRCRRGERLVAKVPNGRWRTQTLIAAIRREGVFAPVVFNGPVNAELFGLYIEEFLKPQLKPGEIVMADNLSSHKAQAIPLALEQAGAELVFLPAYSPDFNPIEMAFAQIKSHMRKLARRTPEGLESAAAEAIAKIKPSNCRNYFVKCGYGST